MRRKYFNYKDIISASGFLISLIFLLRHCFAKDYYGEDGVQWMLPPAWNVVDWTVFVLMTVFSCLWCYDKSRRYKYLVIGFLIGYLWMFQSSFYILINMHLYGWR